MLDGAAGDHLEPLDQRRGGGPAVGLDDRDDDVLAGVEQPSALLEHGEGLADAGRGAEHHPEPTSSPCQPVSRIQLSRDRARLSSSTFTVGSPR